ncbi:MAG TPA: G8 domain-containing protein [Flavisolibacter sp.]|jgi:hypothetical protein|nr:G8 domain-containing protein [Flavisolibacter sp.]
MKNFYLLILSALLASTTFAAPVIKAKANNKWNNKATWDLNRLPAAGDTIVIPTGITVTIDNDETINGFIYMKIGGILNFINSNTILNLSSQATVYVLDGGLIDGSSASQRMILDYLQIFKGNTVISGPVMANSISSGFIVYSPVSLPVKFVGFSATRKASDVLVQWSTSEEVNAAYYQLERSFDGISFTSIAQLKAAGTSSVVTSYSYTDKANTAPTSFYRVRQVDANGQATYTAVKTVKNESAATASVTIAAIQQKVVLQFPAEVKGTIVVRVVNLNGQVVETQTLQGAQGQVVLNTRAKGHNIIALSNGAELNTARQVVL